MAFAAGTYAIGPDTGRITLYVTRAGAAAMVGHNLTITFRTWSGTVVLAGDDPASATVSVSIELGSLEIVEGTGGVVALSADDRKDITATAMRLLEVEREPTARYTSTRVAQSGSGGTIEGTLELRGQSATVTLTLSEAGESTWHATATFQQTTFGIKPYKAFFGALRLNDEVRVEADVNLAGVTSS